MKLKYMLSGASVALALLATAQADVDVYVTGATAFRAAALSAIKSKFTGNFQYAHDKAAGGLTGSTRSVFVGSYTGVTGVTTIHCTFTGSVEGIRALAVAGPSDPTAPAYLPASACTVAAASGGGETANVTTGSATLSTISDIAFSDVTKGSTPYAGASILPSSPAVGIILFTMIASNGCPSVLDNVTSQQARALLSNGYQPLSLFTGVLADHPKYATPSGNAQYIFALGRNDGSGTRTTYLAETGFGITKLVKQYVTIASGSGALSKIQLVPQGGINAQNGQAATGQLAANASTVWGQDVAGNGGYNSGGSVTADLVLTGSSVEVLDETGLDAFSPANQKMTFVSWLSLSDGNTARAGGAKVLGYNGVKLADYATSGTLSTADTQKITSGAYTAWGIENMYYRGTGMTADALTVYNDIKAGIPTNLSGNAGLALTAMKASRSLDGGLVSPKTNPN